MSSNETFHLHKDDCPLIHYSCAKCRIGLFTSKQLFIHDPDSEVGHKLFIKNRHHSRDGKGNACTSVFADPGLVQWVSQGAEDAEDLKRYTEEKKAKQLKEEEKKKKQQQQQAEGGDENADHHDEDDYYNDYEDDYSQYNNYGNSSKKSQSDDEKDLFCPNARCKVKLGSKQWQGTQCSCGAWVTPAFKVLLSRVDAIPIVPEQQKQEGGEFQ